MKKPILVLLALLALTPFTQLLAQAPPVSVPPANGAAAPVPDVAQFLATLSGGQTQTASDLVPAPSFMTGCTSDSQCPPGTRCCYFIGLDKICRGVSYGNTCPVD